MSLLEINKFMLKQAQDKLNSINAVLKDNKNQRNSIIDIIRPKSKVIKYKNDVFILISFWNAFHLWDLFIVFNFFLKRTDFFLI